MSPIRILRLSALLAALALLAAGCSRPSEPLRVGCNPWPGYAPLFLAEELGILPRREVQTVLFPSATDLMWAYRNRAIDVVAVTADEALTLAQYDPDQRIILVCDDSRGADMILAAPEIGKLADLRGRRIGVEPGAVGAYLLARALASVGLSARDAILVPCTMGDIAERFDRQEVDAVVVFEPVASAILARGARRLFDSREIPGEIIDVLLTRNSTIHAKPAQLRLLVEGWFRGQEYLERDPAGAEAQTARRTHFANLRQQLQGLKVAGRAENRRLLAGSPALIVEQLNRLQTVMLEERLLTHAVDLTQIADAFFVAPRREARR